MIEALHPAAIGLTAIAAVLHPGWRRRGAVPGLFAMLLMLAAMVDVMFLGRLGAVLWVGLLVAAAIGWAVQARLRRPRGADVAASAVHDAFGLVVMAALLPMMHGGFDDAAGAAAHAGHGAGAGGLVALVLAAALAHTAASAVASVRGTRPSERCMHVLMGGATLLMAVPVLA